MVVNETHLVRVVLLIVRLIHLRRPDLGIVHRIALSLCHEWVNRRLILTAFLFLLLSVLLRSDRNQLRCIITLLAHFFFSVLLHHLRLAELFIIEFILAFLSFIAVLDFLSFLLVIVRAEPVFVDFP